MQRELWGWGAQEVELDREVMAERSKRALSFQVVHRYWPHLLQDFKARQAAALQKKASK